MTCAHRSLPFGTQVRVTNLANNHSAVLTVNDRGPFIRGRIVDVSMRAASVLGFRNAGVVSVRMETL
jgi:rare lipoprotein A